MSRFIIGGWRSRRGTIDDRDPRRRWSRRSCSLSVARVVTLICLVQRINADDQNADAEDASADGVNQGKTPVLRTDHFADLLFRNGEKLQVAQCGSGDPIVGQLKKFDGKLVKVHEVGDLQLIPLPLEM